MKYFFGITGLVFFSLLFTPKIQAQKSESVLFTIGDESVLLSEFQYIYEKNNKHDSNFNSPESIKEYLDLFIKFKLKVMEAKSRGIDTTQSFINEFKGYRDQLTKPYMTDKSTIETLKKEAYERMKWEIRASHILIRVAKDALPSEVEKAKAKIDEIYKRASKGEDFSALADETSEDPSVKYNHGDLGYFSAFHLIYDFENVAYQTNPGEISKPFRTEFGYHILNVTDKRPYQGQIKVAQIYVSTPPESDSTAKAEAKEKIESIYKDLKEGASWDAMVEQHSDDKRSKVNGGELPPFTNFSYSIPEDFKAKAFALKNDGDFSEPIETQIGWHIVKRLSITGLAPYEEIEFDIERKVNKDSRSRLSEENLINKLKSEYRFKGKSKWLDGFEPLLDSTVFVGKWDIPEGQDLNTRLCQLGKEVLTYKDFANYIKEQQVKERYSNIPFALQQYYKGFVKKSVLDYADRHLEEKYPEFRSLVNEYKEGMMLFDITDKMVWSKAMSDTTGQKEYFEKQKDKYMWKDRVDAVIYICKDKSTAGRVKEMLENDKSPDQIAAKLNSEDPLNVSYTMSKFEKGEEPLLDPYFDKTGIYIVEPGKTENWRTVHLKERIPAQPKKLNEIRGIVIADYQSFLEEKWISELKEKYPVKVNEEVLNSIIHQK